MEDEDYDDVDNEIVAHRGYSRPKIVNHDNSDEGLNDHVKFRLFLARHLALKKYYELNGKG